MAQLACVFLYIEKRFMKTTQKGRRSNNTVSPRESVEERVRRHLKDINSVITEDDIRNVGTVLTEPNETNSNPAPVSKEGKRKKSRKQKKENEADTPEKQVTSWNILSEGYD